MVNKNKDEWTLEAIGNRLRLTRESFDMTQTHFAEQAGISQNTYNQYEKGRKRPSVDNALLLSLTYNLTLDWIYTGDVSGLPFQLATELQKRA